MLSRKLKWYPLFDSESELEDLFVRKTTVVYRSVFGEVLLIKSKTGFHAFKNKCPHQNKPLNDCWTEGDHVVCPFHRYHFSIESGQGHGTYIDKYELKIEEGKVKIGREVWKLF